ncbi:MAG TPA: cytochrome c [Acidobacteriaceae bacterium]
MRGFFLGLLLGLLALPLAATFYLYYGHVPVAVDDPAFPSERQIVHVPMDARIHHEMPQSTPLEPSPANLLLGAQVYREQCASCHGLYGRDSSFAAHMYPDAPQLWAPHGNNVVGVSDDPPGETYWKVKNGIRLSGMPGYAKVLNETQMWQVTVLLAHANQPLPDPVLSLLKQPIRPEAIVPPVHPQETHLPASALDPPPTQ